MKEIKKLNIICKRCYQQRFEHKIDLQPIDVRNKNSPNNNITSAADLAKPHTEPHNTSAKHNALTLTKFLMLLKKFRMQINRLTYAPRYMYT